MNTLPQFMVPASPIKRFVRVKRKGKHEFSSIEIERYVGGGLNQNFPSKGVRLSNPDLQNQSAD